MNFFQHQDSAKKKTSLLIVLLGLAVLALIAITIAAVAFFMSFLYRNSSSIRVYETQGVGWLEYLWHFLQTPVALYIAAGVAGVVAIGSLFKWVQLSGGGKSVAESLGGKLIDPGSKEPVERKILNVVEEMAIASGNPVPPVYLLDCNSINAFAAGLTRKDAVIGVTRGCVELLSRDELQGVMAHEFSHIHNGDMRLNLRLVAVLHGILLIGLIGRVMAGSNSGYGYRHSSLGRSRNDRKFQAVGLALMAIGYGGTFFGNIIKAAVSRQREFLADASAVQFTRNPKGISGALKKIAANTSGASIDHGHAAEFSHMYFAQGIKTWLGGIMATHPPINERITRVEPKWDGELPDLNTLIEQDSIAESESVAMGFQPSNTQSHSRNADSTPVSSQTDPSELSEDILEFTGIATAASIAAADRLIEGLPKSIYDAAHQAFCARALIYGMVLDHQASRRDTQIEFLRTNAHPATYKELTTHQKVVLALTLDQRVTLLQLCMPALKQQSEPQKVVFLRNLNAIVNMDRALSLFEWCAYRSVANGLESGTSKSHRKLAKSKTAVSVLLANVAKRGGSKDVLSALNAGREKLDWPTLSALDERFFNFKVFSQSLDMLAELKPLEQPLLLKAVLATIKSDGKVTANERLMFQVVGDALDCPIPPL